MTERPNDDRLGLDVFDALDAPDQWEDIMNRASVPSIEPRRSRSRTWLMAVAAVALLAVAGTVLAVRLRGDVAVTPTTNPPATLPEPDTLPSVPTTIPVTEPTATSEPTATTAPTTTEVEPTTTPPTTPATSPPVVVTATEWKPDCVDVYGDGLVPDSDEVALATFTGLGAAATIDIVLPTMDVPSGDGVVVDGLPVPGGVLVSVSGDFLSGDVVASSTAIAVFDLDGSLRWRRCATDGAFGATVLVAPADLQPTVAWSVRNDPTDGSLAMTGYDLGTGATVPVDVDLAGRQIAVGERYGVLPVRYDQPPITEDDRVMVFDSLDGTVEEFPYPAFAIGRPPDEVLVDATGIAAPGLTARTFDSRTPEAVFVDGAWTDEPGALAAGDQTLDLFGEDGLRLLDSGGGVIWTVPDFRPVSREGFAWTMTDDVVVAVDCESWQPEVGCQWTGDTPPVEHLVAYDRATGAELWRRPEGGAVLVAEGSVGIATADLDGDGVQAERQLIDLTTGEVRTDAPVYEWYDNEFVTECCGAGAFYWTERIGGVVVEALGDHLRVWYPAPVSGPTESVTVAFAG